MEPGSFENKERNNFTLLRLLFAWSVLFAHSFPITGGGSDPISELLLLPHTWVGGIAVGGFFAISGYLVTGSFVRRGALAFVGSRALRLYPAVLVYCMVAVLVIGPTMAHVSWQTFFAANPWTYFKNAPLWTWEQNLPFVFAGNPIAGSTNGSTWTLPVELRCYVLVLVAGFFGLLDNKHRANVGLAGAIYFLYYSPTSIPFLASNLRALEPIACFLWGALLWINRSTVPLKWPLAIAALLFLPIAAKAGYLGYVVPPTTAYLTCMLAYRTPYINVDKWVGDISYGVYIYAWPIQQAVYRPNQSPWENAAIATPIVFALGYMSWQLIEKPALRLRKVLAFMGSNYSLTNREPHSEGHGDASNGTPTVTKGS